MSSLLAVSKPKTLASAALAALLAFTAVPQAEARDNHGYRSYDRGYNHGHRYDRWRHRDRHYRHHKYYKHKYRHGRHDRHRYKYHHPDRYYGAYGLGVLTGYLLGQYD